MLIESQYSIPMHASVHTQAHVSSMFVYLTLYNSCFIHTSLIQEHDTQTPAAASRATEEWMLICQRSTDIQCDSNCEENNWSDISAAYPNLEELPVFITAYINEPLCCLLHLRQVVGSAVARVS